MFGALSLAACDKPTVVNVPAAPAATPGPAGPAGATGATGAAGSTGATGSQGDAGKPAAAAPSPMAGARVGTDEMNSAPRLALPRGTP